MKIRFIKAALMTSILVSSVAQAEIAIVANPSVSAMTITASEAKKVFLGKKSNVQNGVKVVAYDRDKSTDLFAEFREKVLKKTDQQLTSYWSRIVFTGKGMPPAELSQSDDAAKAVVADTPDAITYIDAANVDSSVKVLLLIP